MTNDIVPVETSASPRMSGANEQHRSNGSASGTRDEPPASALEVNVRNALSLVRTSLGMDVVWLSRFDAADQVFSYVDAAKPGVGPTEGSSGALSGSYCSRVIDGRFPAVIPNTLAEPLAQELEVTRALSIAAYAGVPVTGHDGRIKGMLCATSATAQPGLESANLAVLELVAGLLSVLTTDIADTDETSRADLEDQVRGLIKGDGRRVVLQPIVDVRTGSAVGVEALTRFDEPPQRPDLWFALAGEVGLRIPLELAAARTALDSTVDRPGYVSVNLSPEAITNGGLPVLLEGHDPKRVVIEVTEHAAVNDYAQLNAALAPHRAEGVRIAIDDAGAGYASFRHMLELWPDLIKLDLALVRDIETDPVRQALAVSILALARSAGTGVVAEGVETQAELDTLSRLGVPLVQGYYLCRPEDDPPQGGFATPSPGVVIGHAEHTGDVIARAVRNEPSFEGLARCLIDAVLGITGMETGYLTFLMPGGQLDHRYVRNAGSIELPEGFVTRWSESLCSSMRNQNRTWTNRAAEHLADRPAAEQFGLATFLSTDLTDDAGQRIGTLCAGSTKKIYISDATVAHVQLIAQALATQRSRRQPPTPP